jgi:hypothetical protein
MNFIFSLVDCNTCFIPVWVGSRWPKMSAAALALLHSLIKTDDLPKHAQNLHFRISLFSLLMNLQQKNIARNNLMLFLPALDSQDRDYIFNKIIKFKMK